MRFAWRTAWRALVPANRVAKEQQAPVTSLWLGPAAHLVHYPVRAGTMMNIVAIVADSCRRTGWSGLGAGSEIASRFACWAPAVQALLDGPHRGSIRAGGLLSLGELALIRSS